MVKNVEAKEKNKKRNNKKIYPKMFWSKVLNNSKLGIRAKGI